MHICMVSSHGCIRVLKETQALQDRGHVVDLLVRSLPFGFDKFRTCSVYHEHAGLMRAVEASQADIFHVHNEPDDIVWVTKEASGKRPVVYDVHDLDSLRWGKPKENEVRAFQAADALIYVSEGTRKAAGALHGSSAPSIVLPCYASERFMAGVLSGDRLANTVVYQGGISESPFMQDAVMGTVPNYRFYVPAVEKLQKLGLSVHMFKANFGPTPLHESAGAVVMGPLVYPTLMRVLRSYRFGLVGSAIKSPAMDVAMPNKLFEYISQGVVPMVLNCPEAAAFAREMGAGVELDPETYLAKPAWSLETDGEHLAATVERRRFEWTMERHIGEVEALYQRVCQ